MLLEISECRKVDVDQISPNPLLDHARVQANSSIEEDFPEPVWLVEDDEEVKPVWLPVSLDNESPVHALVVDGSEESIIACTLKLWERYDPPDPVEIGRILNFLEDSNIDMDVATAILGLSPSGEIIESYKSLVELPESLKEELHQEQLSPRLFRYLQRVPNRLRKSLLELIEWDSRTFSVQEMRQLTEAVRRIPEDQYDKFLSELPHPEESDEPDEIASDVSQLSRKIAFPEVKKREEQFYQDLEELNLDGRLNVSAPNNFEGDYIDFSFRCHRDDDLSALAGEVKKCQTLLQHV